MCECIYECEHAKLTLSWCKRRETVVSACSSVVCQGGAGLAGRKVAAACVHPDSHSLIRRRFKCGERLICVWLLGDGLEEQETDPRAPRIALAPPSHPQLSYARIAAAARAHLAAVGAAATSAAVVVTAERVARVASVPRAVQTPEVQVVLKQINSTYSFLNREINNKIIFSLY